jgi:Protein of unknown function (DUF4238)
MEKYRIPLTDAEETLVSKIDLRLSHRNHDEAHAAYATIGASLLADLTLTLIRNDSDTPFIASDTPVVLHNRLYEGQSVSVAGYANVGLQLFLPLGPRLTLFGFDGAAYAVHADLVACTGPPQSMGNAAVPGCGAC